MNDNAEIRKDAPIYKQLSDEILRSIKTGKLPAGSRLPTVRELAEEKNLSQGTIKHAYDYLESLGVIEMTQGKGTFVREPDETDSASRKDRAMAAIDGLFRELETLGFTPREMEIYIDLKLRVWKKNMTWSRLRSLTATRKRCSSSRTSFPRSAMRRSPFSP